MIRGIGLIHVLVHVLVTRDKDNGPDRPQLDEQLSEQRLNSQHPSLPNPPSPCLPSIQLDSHDYHHLAFLLPWSSSHPCLNPPSPRPKVGFLLFTSLAMASKAVIPFLVAMMILTGVCNTLLTKYQVGWRCSSDAFSKLTGLRICNVYAIAIQAFQRSACPSLNQ